MIEGRFRDSCETHANSDTGPLALGGIDPHRGGVDPVTGALALGRLDCQMLDERKAAILRAVVEEYIETGQPVGSGHVARAPGVDVSSATVRNEMGLLESEGFLRQPHTSAGRVPTEKGYRFFVDHLRRPAAWPRARPRRCGSSSHAHGEVEQMLSETSRLLSDLTHLTSVVVAPAAGRDHRPVGAARRAQRHVGRPRRRAERRIGREAPSTCPPASAKSGWRRRACT